MSSPVRTIHMALREHPVLSVRYHMFHNVYLHVVIG